MQRFGFHAQPTSLVISFNGPLDPSPAQKVSNYRIVAPNGHRITVRSAIYNSATDSVTLLLGQQLVLRKSYRLTINGTAPSGLTNPEGLLLDGAGTGQPGSNFVTSVTKSNLAGSASQRPTGGRPQGESQGPFHSCEIGPSQAREVKTRTVTTNGGRPAEASLRLVPLAGGSSEDVSLISTRVLMPVSGELGAAGHRNGGHGQRAEFVAWRTEVFLGVEDEVGRDDLAGVGGRAAHQGQQRALSRRFAVVDRLAGPDRGEHLVVLDLVHVGLLRVRVPISPFVLAGDGIAEDVGRPLAAQDVVLDLELAVLTQWRHWW